MHICMWKKHHIYTHSIQLCIYANICIRTCIYVDIKLNG